MALIQDDPWSITFLDDIGCGSIDYVHSVALRSAPIASCYLELEKVNQDLESKLHDDFRSILDSMDALVISSAPSSPSLPPNPPARASSSVLNASLTVSAYSWLLENVANPYPSSAVKASFAKQHNCSLSTINSWFVNTRRRIGWTALCRDLFDKCRADTLDAAHRALVNEDPNRPLSPEVIHAFVSVKVVAEDLYSSTLTKNTLADSLDSILKDMTDSDVTSEEAGKDCKAQEAIGSSKTSEVGSKHTQYDYASGYSSSSSPVPPLVASLSDDSEEEEEVSPPTLAGRKRHFSCSGPAYSSAPFPTKRRRYLCLNTSSLDEASISSLQKPLEQVQSPRGGLIAEGPIRVTERKQLLPDTGPGIPTCPEGSITGLHHAVSDLPPSTLESDKTFNEWLKSNFDDLFSLPPVASVVEPDLSTQWEVELFNNYTIPQELQRQPFESLDSQDQRSTSADLFALDELLQSLERTGFIVPSDVIDPVTISAVDSIPQDLLSLEPINWTALLNTQTYEPALDPIFHQFQTGSLPLPEIGLPILQLPLTLSSFISTS